MTALSPPRPPVPKAKLRPPRAVGLRRERLQRALTRVSDHRLCVVLGPAGSGKTTLLAELAAETAGPVAWYRAEGDDPSGHTVLRGLDLALAAALDTAPRDAACVEELVELLDNRGGERLLLVIDDLHLLHGGPDASTVERLVRDAPPDCTVLVGTRCLPTFDLSRLRVSGDLLEIRPDDLRFRSWEVEQLFREFYREPLPPEDLAELARRTEGWAAGLQLFHLASRGRSARERRRLLDALGTRSRDVREYLARNVLDGLPEDLRRFLVHTCVLGHLTGTLCDELLGTSGSEALLEELERRQVFTIALEEGSAYRYHEVLRCHLEQALVERVGPDEARVLYRRAGALLHAAGELPHALRAYCRGEDWDGAAALLGRDGEHLAADHGPWLDLVPPALLDQDPWLVLATARRELGRGCLQGALRAYHRAERLFASTSAAEVCRRERVALAAWLEPMPGPSTDWLGLLRASLQRDPLKVAAEAATLPGATGRFVEGVAAMLAGRITEGARLLSAVAELPDATPILALLARFGAAVPSVVEDRPNLEQFELLAEEAESLQLGWLARLCRWAHGLAGGGEERMDTLPPSGGWEIAVGALIGAVSSLKQGTVRVEAFDDSAKAFRKLGALVAEAWVRSGLALAMAAEGLPGAHDAALRAESAARSASVRGAEALALWALALADPGRTRSHRIKAEEVTQESGLAPLLSRQLAVHLAPPRAPAETGSRRHKGEAVLGGDRPPPRLTLKCFGGFRLTIDGRQVDCGSLKPRLRSVLHLLALHAGRPVHRESLVEAIWPHLDASAGLRNLYVALSSLRQVLEPGTARSTATFIVREGETYRLGLPDAADVDLISFEGALAEATMARASNDARAVAAHLERALAAYTGELLPEDGPAEWVVKERERYRIEAGDAAHALAELHRERGDAGAAASVCERAVRLDPYRDATWRLLIAAHTEAGDQVAATRARRGYEELLHELDLVPGASRGR